jgi:rsbT co-antagonist protein RsbR
LALPLDASAPLASSVVAAVARTQESVVLNNAAEDARFGTDPYLVAHRPKSVLSVPLAAQGQLVGVLYLENAATANAFPPARLELTALLASQAAIAIDNARLFAHAQQATAQVRRTNDALESEVARRTEELRRANAHLEQELAERERIEAERAALQATIVQAQQARLAELSTPIIPIADRVMVMPLIGTLDEERAQQLMETALRGAQANRAAVVIVDLTGVREVNSTVARSLATTTSALRLLGTAMVLTGVRSEVAHTLIRLNIDLGSVVTRSTLQSGVAYALARFGGSTGPNEGRAWRPG